MKSQSEIENETKTLLNKGEYLLKNISLISKDNETDRDGSIVQLKEKLNEVKKEMAQKISDFDKAIGSCQRNISKIKSGISQVQGSEKIGLQKMINAQESEIGFLQLQITLLERFFQKILVKTVLDPNMALNKVLGGSGNNQVKGTIGEAISSYVMSQMFTYPGCYLLSESYEIVNREKRHSDINSEELAYRATVDYFEKHPSQEYVLADRPFEGGQKGSVDSVIMLISREDTENWKKGNPCKSVYFVFEAKADSSRLSESQKSSNYVKEQAARMYNTTQYDSRKQLGSDLLKAVNEDRVHYISYNLDTQNSKVRKIQHILKPKANFRYSQWLNI